MSQRTAGNPPSTKYGPRPAKAATHAAASSGAAAAPAALSQQFDPAALLAAIPWPLVAKFAAWCACWWLTCRIEFGSIFFVVSLIAAIFLNLGSETSSGTANPNRLSAYSVFNRGAQRIAGSMDADAIDDQIRQRVTTKKGIDLSVGAGEQREHYTRKSKAANQPCVCGSGRKYKRCCNQAANPQMDREWEEWEEEWVAK